MILFVGNMLTKYGLNPTFIEILAKELSNDFNIQFVSNKKNQLYRIYDMIFCLMKDLKNIKIVIIDTYSTKAYYYALLLGVLCILFKKRYILVLSGGNLGFRLKSSILFPIILKKSFQNISPSKFLCNIFNDYETIYLPNFIDISKYPYKKREEILPKLLWVRSLHSIYNPQMAVNVLEELLKTYPQSKLCFVGPSKDDTLVRVKKMINEKKINDKVTIKGKMNKKDWIQLSENYDLFINTTNYDNHPITILEAMALGLPIVSTNVGGISYFLEHEKNAKLVKKNDVLGMVNSIISYMSNQSEALNISANARELVVSQYSKEVVLKSWYKIINEAINL